MPLRRPLCDLVFTEEDPPYECLHASTIGIRTFERAFPPAYYAPFRFHSNKKPAWRKPKYLAKYCVLQGLRATLGDRGAYLNLRDLT